MENIRMTLSALTLDECELMLHIIDMWIRFHFTGYGAHRVTSWNRRANDGYRAQIIVEMPAPVWDFIWQGATSEICERLNKSLSINEIGIHRDVSTTEAWNAL